MLFKRDDLNVDAVGEADERIGSETVGVFPTALDGEAERGEDGDGSFELADGHFVDQMV